MKWKNIIKNELSGWKTWEVAWLVISCGVIFGLSIYWKDTPMGILSATTGVACVVCTGKGKLCTYVFGAINALLYAIIAYKARFYGEVMLNTLYYFPMQFYGFYVWSKHMDETTKEVKKRRMSSRGRGYLVGMVAVTTVIYGYLLERMGGQLPYVDAFTTGTSVIAMIVEIKRYMEQWILWLLVDGVTVVMWGIAFSRGNESIATLLMWIVYTITAVLMYIKWKKEVY